MAIEVRLIFQATAITPVNKRTGRTVSGIFNFPDIIHLQLEKAGSLRDN